MAHIVFTRINGRLIIAVLAPMLLLAGCGGGKDPAAVVDAVRATEQAQLQSLAADDLVGVVRLYADDAVLVRPDGSRIVGGAAIADEYGALIADENFALSIEPVGGWGSAADDLAVLTSNVDFTTSDPETGEPATLPMFSQTVWRREAAGTWMIVSAFNAPRQAAQPAEPEAAEGE